MAGLIDKINSVSIFTLVGAWIVLIILSIIFALLMGGWSLLIDVPLWGGLTLFTAIWVVVKIAGLLGKNN